MKICLQQWDVAKRYARIAVEWGKGIPTHVRHSRGALLSLPRRMGEQFVLQARNGITAMNYYDLDLFEARRSWADKRQYIGHFDLPRLFHCLNSNAHEALARDKIVFHLYCDALNIPTVAPLAVYAPGCRTLPWCCLRSPGDLEAFMLQPDSAELFFKTDAGSKGRGALSLGRRLSPESWMRLPDEAEMTLDEVVAHLTRAGDSWLVQRRLVPHRSFADVVPHVCPTVRVMTLLDGDKVHFTGALVRFGDGNFPADNAGSGGIVFLIDLATGKLTKGAHSVGGRTIFRSSHHRTGVEVSGRNVPFWPEIIALAKNAASNFPASPYLGWDIAVTDDGPLILETNTMSGLLSLQKLNGKGVLETELRKFIEPVQGVLRSGVTLRERAPRAQQDDLLQRIRQAG